MTSASRTITTAWGQFKEAIQGRFLRFPAISFGPLGGDASAASVHSGGPGAPTAAWPAGSTWCQTDGTGVTTLWIMPADTLTWTAIGAVGGAGVFTDLTATGNTILGNLDTADTVTLTGRIASNIVPSTHNTRDLGSTALRWAAGWFQGAVTATGGFLGALNGTVGATTPSTGAFTTIASSGAATLGDAAADTHLITGLLGIGGIQANAYQSIDMADAAHELMFVDVPGAGKTLITGNMLVIDPNSSGASEALTLPPAADGVYSAKMKWLFILNSGGEIIVANGTSIAAGKGAFCFSNGAGWAVLLLA